MKFERPATRHIIAALIFVVLMLAFTGCSQPAEQPASKPVAPTATATNTPVNEPVNEPVSNPDTDAEDTGQITYGAPSESIEAEAKAAVERAMLDQSILTGAGEPADIAGLPIKPGTPAARKFNRDATSFTMDTWKGNGAVPAAPFGTLVSSLVTPIKSLANGNEIVNVDVTATYYVTRDGQPEDYTLTRRYTLTLTPSGEDSRNWWISDYRTETLDN